MQLYYVDESGGLKVTPQADASSETVADWFVLAAVGVPDTSRQKLALDLRKIRERYFGDMASDWAATELKGRSIAITRARLFESLSTGAAPAGYEQLIDRKKFGNLESDIAHVFARFRPIVFVVAVDKRRLAAEQPDATVLGTAYGALSRRVALTVQDTAPGESAMFVADEQREHEQYFGSGELAASRRRMNQTGARPAQFDLILDKPLWIDSAQSSLDREIIQLADIAAFHVRERAKGSVPSGPIWPALRRCLRASNGSVKNDGLVIHPKPKTWPEALE
ncbi:MAG: DUF3800 domain-containing protein [Pseudolysinimonas sp.]